MQEIIFKCSIDKQTCKFGYIYIYVYYKISEDTVEELMADRSEYLSPQLWVNIRTYYVL